VNVRRRNKAEDKKELYEPALDMLTHDLEARGTGWNQPPQLAFLYEDDDGTWRLSALPLPDFIWSPEPGQALHAMAAGMKSESGAVRRLIGGTKPADWRGVAFFAEAWLVKQEKQQGSEDGEEGPDPVLEEMAKARMLHQHPARVECRCWWAAMPDGTFIRTTLSREDEQLDEGIIPLTDPHYKDIVGSGRIPAALTIMAKAFNGDD
jgi:hypothetical protein